MINNRGLPCIWVNLFLGKVAVTPLTGRHCSLFQFAADFTEKTLFKTIMVRLLKSALQGERENLTTLLTDEILNVDNQLLQVEKATNEVSGTVKRRVRPDRLESTFQTR